MKIEFINKLNPDELCDKMVEIAEFCRVNDYNFLLLESKWPDCDNHFLVEAIQLIVDGTELTVLNAVLKIRLETYIADHYQYHALQKYFTPKSFYNKIICLKIIKTAIEQLAQKSNPRVVLYFCKAHINKHIEAYSNKQVKLKY